VDDGTQDALLEALVSDHRQAEISAADRAMLDYALELTHRPSDIGAAHVKELSDRGFDDRAIHDICAITAYFAFVNQIADGLGVELEP
jgi:uncharacterized peroxidase-related enzyme